MLCTRTRAFRTATAHVATHMSLESRLPPHRSNQFPRKHPRHLGRGGYFGWGVVGWAGAGEGGKKNEVQNGKSGNVVWDIFIKRLYRSRTSYCTPARVCILPTTINYTPFCFVVCTYLLFVVFISLLSLLRLPIPPMRVCALSLSLCHGLNDKETKFSSLRKT